MASNITLPEGSTNHGNPNLLCTPTQWYDILIFFLTNYLAHAATVGSGPGQSLNSSINYPLYAIFLPSTALVRAVGVIARRASFETKNPLKCAARAGALCMVLRKTPKEESDVQLADLQMVLAGQAPSRLALPSGDALQRSSTRSPESIESTMNVHWWEPQEQPPPVSANCKVHGEYWLHEDYFLAAVPPTASLKFASDPRYEYMRAPNREGIRGEARLASSQNFLKLSISLAQAIWAIITIYRSRGNQIDQYGYAAFGLTVVPFAMMSILNALAGLTTPDYPCLFVIRTPVMTEAETKEKAFFIGELSVELEDSYTSENNPTSRLSRLLDHSAEVHWRTGHADWLVHLIGFVLSLVPLVIVGGLTGFRKGKSSQIERGFTMSWLIVGILGSFFANYYEDGHETKSSWRIFFFIFDFFYVFVMLGAPAIGGMVMVGKMIQQYGNCILID